MSLDRLIEMDAIYFATCKPSPRCWNVEWAACLGLGYV